MGTERFREEEETRGQMVRRNEKRGRSQIRVQRMGMKKQRYRWMKSGLWK